MWFDGCIMQMWCNEINVSNNEMFSNWMNATIMNASEWCKFNYYT